jgi:hypothetical protein
MGRVVHDCAVTHCVEARPVPTEFAFEKSSVKINPLRTNLRPFS